MQIDANRFGWSTGAATCAHEYLAPVVMRIVDALATGRPLAIVDIGCGNGYVASQLTKQGHVVVAMDISDDALTVARAAYPSIHFYQASVYDDVSGLVVNPMDCVIALEVIEHLTYPKKLFEQSRRLLKDGGTLILSTPYHGYLKNLGISLVNGWDHHFMVEQDEGHIKFFSKRTLSKMAGTAGFNHPRFYGSGRVPWLWKSMIMTVVK